jgi:23S rRNA (pseudouridine1915-N3)-methyltransferase
MKIKLIVVGKTNKQYLIQGEKEYEKRLKHYCKFEEYVIPGLKSAKNISQNELKSKEGKLILKQISSPDEVIILDDKGKSYSSMDFSSLLNQTMVKRVKNLVFIVGGAYGFSDEVYKRSNAQLSLSKMTFSHQIVRLIFKEQLYRAFTITKGEKYHHD